jgi:hypothetical protein
MASLHVTGDPEKAMDRTVTLRSAILAAVAALLVGLGTAGGALYGVFLTTSASAEQARLEFLRPQQQRLYADFLSAADETGRMVNYLDGRRPTTEDLRAASDALRALQRIVDEMRLVGGDATVDAADNLMTQLRYVNYVNGPVRYCEDQPEDLSYCPTDLVLVERPPGFDDPSPPDYRAEFVDRAREELGAAG